MTNQPEVDRRAFLALCSIVAGAGPLALTPSRIESLATGPGSRSVRAGQDPPITKEHVIAAERLIGLEFTDAERDLLVQDLAASVPLVVTLHGAALTNDVGPAVRFDPEAPGIEAVPSRKGARVVIGPSRKRRAAPRGSDEDLAFRSVAELAVLLRTRKVSATELTRLSLDRLKRHDPTLQCVVTLTEDRALEQAARADKEIRAGRIRGPLHGIPWGAKDLFSVPGYPTTWGSPIFQDQRLPDTATVVSRLDSAGAVLVAKLSLGELAMGDVWFGGTTKNPWKVDQGSSGSSAGSASATAAGLVGFALGTETLGSIVSPATRCGVSGLRPTFGRVSRFGAMSLSPSMDKAGPLCRTAEDCGLVLRAIEGADGRDPSAVDRPFRWSPGKRLSRLRIGFLASAFDVDRPTKALDDAVLDALRGQGAALQPIELDASLPVASLGIILRAEAAAMFDELTRTNQDDRMVRQVRGAWPPNFRAARFISAVDYLNANRVRSLVMRRMDELMRRIDVFVTPSFGGNVLLVTNLTGHPALTVPSGFNADGTPVSISFIGRLWGEGDLLTVGQAYQVATQWHAKRPAAFS